VNGKEWNKNENSRKKDRRGGPKTIKATSFGVAFIIR